MADQTLLTLTEAGRRLGVHRDTVRAWVGAGTLAAVPCGTRRRVPAAEVERLLNGGTELAERDVPAAVLARLKAAGIA